MRLRSLEIQGFKSFPDKTTLTFGGGITAVVGPNGSGKSNISDAVRWVLGEQSTKNLRGQKMEDVIFGGTQSRKAQGFAFVQLTIDNTDRALAHDADEVTISRKLYRSGDSEYRLCGTMVRLKDIHELLMDTGLGRDGYSIIGQGRIAEIVSAKSAARREIFEEAAGISKFRYRKEEAEKRLNQAEENLVRLRDILAELEGRVGPLKAQAEKAKAFVELSGEKKTLEISLWLTGLTLLKEQIAGQRDKVYLCKNQYEQLERQAAEIEEKIQTVYQQSQEMGVQTEENRTLIRQMEERLAKGESEAAVLDNDIRHNEITIKRLAQDLESADLGAGKLAGEIESKKRQLVVSQTELEAMASRIEASEQRLEEQKEQAQRVEQEIANLNTKHTALDRTINETKMERAASETLRTESAQRLEALRQSTTGYDEAVTDYRNALQECKQQQEECQSQLESLANSLKGYELKRGSRSGKLEEIVKQQQTLQSQAEQKLQRAKLLEDLEASMEGFAHSVKFILGESRKGSLGGVFGPVSSLIKVNQQYATAIETALGAAMQNIVVKDDRTAKQAIMMLKNAKAGRATFLPLSSMKGRELNISQVRDHDGFIGVASALVEYDKRFESVMGYLLGRICIVEDLDAGTQIAKSAGYSFRIVTLDGQVINAGGSYTGGSTGKQSGVLGRRSEIEKLTGQAQTLQKDAEALEQERKALSEELAALDASVSGIQAERQTAQEELMRLGYAQENIEKDLAQAKSNQALAVKELESIAKRLEDLQGTESSTAKVIEELEKEVAGVEEQIAAATARRAALAEGTETAATSLADQRMAHMEARKDAEQMAQEIVRLEEQVRNAGTHSIELQQEMDRLKETNGAIAVQIEALGQEKEQLSGEVEAYNKRIADLTEQRTALEASTTGLRNQERELAAQREGVSRELVRLEERQNSLQTDYDSIISKLWDEYELTKSSAEQEAVPIPDKDKADRRLAELKGKIRALGTVNVAAIEEYAEVSERYEFLSAQVKDVETSKKQLMELIYSLTDEMRTLFSENFHKISENFSKIFVQLFGGGHAELTLTEGEDVLEAGVDIHVQPPGKIIKNLSLLSGGEQAFIAIAIYFAILKVKPAPFCLLDEIEAALDDVNVVKFASYLRQMTQKTQFIAITHRRGTMEEADMLYGVTMQDEGVSKLLELNVTEVETKLGMKNV